jgi:hypothetical protein
MSGACWEPHRAMLTPGAGGRRPLKPRRAPLPSATLPLNRPPLGPGCSGEPLGVPADPSPPRIQFQGLAGDPIGLCLSQGRGSGVPGSPGSPSAVCHPPSQPRLQWRATGGPGGPFPAPDPVFVACWGPHRAMLTPGAEGQRPRKRFCCLPPSLPTAHRLAQVAVAGATGGPG